MTPNKDLNEQIIAKALSEHAERGISASSDLWPEVKKRLGMRESSLELNTDEPIERRTFSWLLGGGQLPAQPRTNDGNGRAKPYRYVVALAGVLGVVVLAAVVMATISRLSQHVVGQDATPSPVPATPSLTPMVEMPPVGTVQVIIPPGVFDESIQTPTPLPTLPPLGLVRDGDGYRLQGLQREYVFANWVGPSRFLVPLAHPTKPDKGAVLVDLDSGVFRQSQPGEFEQPGLANPDNRYAIKIEEATNPDGSGKSTGVDLLHLDSGNAEKLYDVDPSTAQLADAKSRTWAFGEVDSHISARWVDTDTYLLTRVPTTQGWGDWGKVLIGDTKKGTLRTLAEHGKVLVTLPDRSLLMSEWIDAEVQLLTPPYTGTPRKVSPSGPWADGWAASPDGKMVAWFEMSAPPKGDWSSRIPIPASEFSPDPQPEPHTLVIWNRTTGQVKRFPVKGAVWPDTTWVYWRKDSSALLYATNDYSGKAGADLYSLTPDGKSSHLASHLSYIYRIRVEANDSSLYFETTSDQQHYSRLMRRYPDGRLDISCDYLQLDCYVDQAGRLVNVQAGEIIVQDLATGATKRAPAPSYAQTDKNGSWYIGNGYSVGEDVLLSPDGRWVAFRDLDGGAFDFIRVK